MSRAVVTAVLLLVCILGTETTSLQTASYQRLCSLYRDYPCSDGWSRIDHKRCGKFFGIPKTFQDAQEHCRTLNSDLVSVHSPNEMVMVLCLTWRANSDHPNVWTGAMRSEGVFKHTDGSEFKYAGWFANTEGQDKDCIEVNAEVMVYLNNVPCSEERYFVCAKEM